MNRIIALVDANNFYVSCERLFRPDLVHRPVIVLSNNDGRAVARSNEAKKIGVAMGAPMFQIRDLISTHKIATFSSNYALYADISARIMKTLRKFAPHMEVYSIDEAFLDLSEIRGEDVAAYGRRIQQTVAQWVGIPVSVGMAPTKTLAKIAVHEAKKTSAGIVDLMDKHRQEEVMKLTPVGQVWGVGRRYNERLGEMHIQTALELCRADAKTVRRRFSVCLERTVMELRGLPCYALEEQPKPRKQIISSRSFGQAVSGIKDLQQAVSVYTHRAAKKLQREGMACQSITVGIRTSFFNEPRDRYARSAKVKLLQPTSNTLDLVDATLYGLQRIYRPGYSYAKAEIILADFVEAGFLQYSLFDNEPQAGSEKNDALHCLRECDLTRLVDQQASLRWAMRRDHISPAYTTSWRQIPEI